MHTPLLAIDHSSVHLQFQTCPPFNSPPPFSNPSISASPCNPPPKTESSLNTKEIIGTEAKVFVGTYARTPVVLASGKGCKLYDVEGREYLDLSSGIAVNALGHGDEDWLKAVVDQANTLTHVSNVYYTIPQVPAFGVFPDIMTLAKPLAGGLPIGAALVTERVASAIAYGDHGSTFAGAPLVCNAALAVLNKISDSSFLNSVTTKGRESGG